MHKKRVSSKIFLEKKIILPSQQRPNGRKVKTNKQTNMFVGPASAENKHEVCSLHWTETL